MPARQIAASALHPGVYFAMNVGPATLGATADSAAMKIAEWGFLVTPEQLNALAAQNGWPDDFAERERIYTTEFSPQPVPRLGRVDEIAAAVAFLASPRSDFTTGARLRIDGGGTKAV